MPSAEVLQILDYEVVADGPVNYAPEHRPKAKRDFIIAFQIWCPKCKLSDFAKISNIGWQGGRLKDSWTFRLGAAPPDF